MPDSHQLRTTSIIARVSAFWRHVARTTPRLWNLLFIASARDIDRYYDYYVDLARDAPLRAHCTGATTTLLFLLDCPLHAHHGLTSVKLATLASLRRPWSYVHYMPYLEDLTINIVHPDFAPVTGEWSFYRELSWEHPCTTLISLTIVAHDDEGMLDFMPVQTLLLQCSQSLERIDIDVGLAYTSHYREQMDFMPRLAVIEMRRSGCELLRCIEAPNVRAVSFSCPHTNFAGDLLSFSLKASTFPHLRRLEISQ
ncbi:hypothetical protein K523DRAFT_352164 [Schizophyllum commune Tattone D]|nr:hypothetical protein K523DRAFT_352164 [Schizophyllum commune Tattone D]